MLPPRLVPAPDPSLPRGGPPISQMNLCSDSGFAMGHSNEDRPWASLCEEPGVCALGRREGG